MRRELKDGPRREEMERACRLDLLTRADVSFLPANAATLRIVDGNGRPIVAWIVVIVSPQNNAKREHYVMGLTAEDCAGHLNVPELVELHSAGRVAYEVIR